MGGNFGKSFFNFVEIEDIPGESLFDLANTEGDILSKIGCKDVFKTSL